MKGYFVQTDKINHLQCESIEREIKRCGQASHVDLQIRINGAYEYAEADWIKHMLELPEVDDLTAARMQIAQLQDKLAHSQRVAEYYRAKVPADPIDSSPERQQPQPRSRWRGPR
jgi:hypothetical protein